MMHVVMLFPDQQINKQGLNELPTDRGHIKVQQDMF